jgi:acetyl esterase/lipase
MASEDAQRTVGLVRFHATEWHIDPRKIGVLGFSAGGRLGQRSAPHFKKRLYSPVDAADTESCRPNFAVTIYPGHLTITAAEWDADKGTKKFVVRGAEHLSTAEKTFGLNPEVPVIIPKRFLYAVAPNLTDTSFDTPGSCMVTP